MTGLTRSEDISLKSQTITKSTDVPTGKILELTPEQKAIRNVQDKKILESYKFQIDNFKVEIMKLEEILRLDLANREIKENLKSHKESKIRFENLITVLKKRIK